MYKKGEREGLWFFLVLPVAFLFARGDERPVVEVL